MGVDISHIIRHGFRHVEDKKASKAFVFETIDCLKQNLLIHDDQKFFYRYDKESNEFTFKLPIYDVQFILHNGFWQIESYYHYCQIVMHQGDYFWLRLLTYDIARALGQNEAWYATEYYTWDGCGCDTPEVTFEQWMENCLKKYGKPIPEYNRSSIMAQGDVHIPDYEPIYHDSFRECKEEFDFLQSKLCDYKLLGLVRFGNGFLRGANSGGFNLINVKTLKPMFNEPVEGAFEPVGAFEFAIKRNGLSALFDMDGHQLTDFVEGNFDWKWAPHDPLKDQRMLKIIYNEKAGIELPPR